MLKLTDPMVAEHFNTLPEGLKSAIQRSNWEASMRQIAAENRLHIDQADIVGTEVMLVMIGLTDPVEFYATIIREAKLDAKTAEKVTLDVNEKIFILIRKELVEMYETEPVGKSKDQDELESKEELLAEIEKPQGSEKVTLGLSRMPGTVRAAEKPAPAEEPEKEEIPASASEAKKTEEPGIPLPPPPPGPAPIFVRKLEEKTQSVSESKTIPFPKADREPRKYSVDPYREAPAP